MGRPKLSKKVRKNHMVSIRVKDDTYNKLLDEAGKDSRKIPEVVRAKIESA